MLAELITKQTEFMTNCPQDFPIGTIGDVHYTDENLWEMSIPAPIGEYVFFLAREDFIFITDTCKTYKEHFASLSDRAKRKELRQIKYVLKYDSSRALAYQFASWQHYQAHVSLCRYKLAEIEK